MIQDTIVGRIGMIIDVRKSNIKRYRNRLKKEKLDTYTRKTIESELKSEQKCLSEAMDLLDTYMGNIKKEFAKIKKEYC